MSMIPGLNGKVVGIILLLLILLLLLVPSFSIPILIISSLVLSLCMGVWNIRGIGIELVLMTTVITGFAYGSMVALIIGFILITFHMVMSQHLGVYLLWVIPGYCIVGFLSGTTTMSIAKFGIIATLALNAINFLITAIIFKENLGKFLPFAITNVAFNSILFLYAAPHIMNFIS